ncbi:hypothetical protein EPN54_03810 [bacterium]|nr:MAG: hypothetical protein EPN54_03810 [bacterium]
MPEINISNKLKNNISLFVNKLKERFSDDLVSVILYGSAASGEFVDRRSNLNFLVILKDPGTSALKKGAEIVGKFPAFEPLFLTEDQIDRSTDIFPIEFLDMKENYTVIYGKDCLKDINVDTGNLRFQCEHELKIKLISLRQLYLKSSRDKRLLLHALLKSFTSSLHILRNVLRLKGITPPYKKDLIIAGLAKVVPIEVPVWERILAVKNKNEHLNKDSVDLLFLRFIEELEKTADLVDKL